ncbi:MAG: hypothetical protein NZO58_13600, partial [Gemmataceae bacterium]|nr:hypothetical protein [Gemmataceae bacterium]
MGPTIQLFTAALVMGQAPVVVETHPARNCTCQKATSGPVVAQPEFVNETRTTSWWSWRSGGPGAGSITSGAPTTVVSTPNGPVAVSEPYRGPIQEPSWIDNRPILGRIKGWFNRNDNYSSGRYGAPMIRIDPAPGGTGPVAAPSASGIEYHRRLPTTNEPPLAAPAPLPKITTPDAAAPLPSAPTAPAGDKPLQIEVEPLSFRPAGSSGRGLVTASATAPASAAPSPDAGSSAISPRFVDKVGQPGDYSWITGQIEVRGGTYIIHYATPDTIDTYGGRLELSSAQPLTEVRHGDLVSVH